MQSLCALVQACCTADRVLLTGPIGPDGDSIGAALALQQILRARGVRVDVAGTPSYRYDWMPGADEMVPDAQIAPLYDAVVVLDGDCHRLPEPVRAAFEAASIRGIVDHHGSTRADRYTHWCLDPTAPSTCEMVYRALPELDVSLCKRLATLLYVGTIFDTGGFRYSNTTPQTHQMGAALVAQGIEHAAISTRVLLERRESGLRLTGHVFSTATLHRDGTIAVGLATLDLKERFANVDGDLEGIVDGLIHTFGVKVAALLVERESGEVKYSLRSRGEVDVSRVARDLSPSGGGHPKAAGATVHQSIDTARHRAIEVISRHLDARGAKTP